MKPAYKTIGYVVYSPNYVPGQGMWRRVKQKSAAVRQCRKWGVGSEFYRTFDLSNKRHGRWWTEQRPWVFE